MSRQGSCNQKQKSSVFFTILFITMVASAFSPGFSMEKVVVPPEEAEMLKDYGKAFSDSIDETKDWLEYILKKYNRVKDKFGNHKYPKILELINTLDRSNLGKHLNNGISTLSNYQKGIKKVTGAVADVESIITFYDNYKPDKNNPLRSLKQISNALEELNHLIVKIDPSDGILTKPVRVVIDFYQKSAGAFHGALDRVRQKIKERGGGGIGLGFTADTDKERLFIKKFPGETAYRYPWIKYIKPGSSQEEVEFWDNANGRAFAWRNKNWMEIKPGIAGLRKVYDGMRLAFNTRPDLNTLLSRCNTGWDNVLQAEEDGKQYFNLLFSDTSCVAKILAYKKIKLERFSEKKFIARYTFRRDTRKKIDQAVKLIKNNLFVEGKVTEGENPDKGLANILITAESSGARAQSMSEPGGWFALLFSIKPSDSRGNARVIINAPGYESYNKDWPLRQQCNSWYNIALVSEKEKLVRVPGLIGLTAANAISKLEALQLVPVKTDGGIPPSIEQSGRITWQKPKKDSMVEKGSKVSFQAYWLVSDEAAPPAGDKSVAEPDIKTDPESTAEPETGHGNSDNGNDGLEGYVGGLIIAGKTEIISGEGVSYTACDGAGKPYPADRSYSWNSSVEDVLVLGHSGQPVSGSGFKAGTSTIVLHFDGMTKFLDVKVRTKVPDVIGMSTKQAAGTIEGLNLRTSITGNGENIDKLAVVSQSPAPGTIVDADYTVVIEPGDRKANLFSMSGGEKTEAETSIFSMSGGETVKEEAPATGSFTDEVPQEQDVVSPPPTQRRTKPGKSEQKFVVVRRSTNTRTSRYFSFFCDSWYYSIELQNTSFEDIKGKNAYMLVKINNYPYRMYLFVEEKIYSGDGTNHVGFIAKGWIPSSSFRNNIVEISCPALPHIPRLVKKITTPPPSGEILALWKSHVSREAYAKLNLLKQNYEQAQQNYARDLVIHPKSHGYWYDLIRTSYSYAKALAVAAECHCNLRNFRAALELNSLAISVHRKYLSIQEESGPYNRIGSVGELITMYRQQANILLLGFHDKKGFLANSAAAIKLYIGKAEKNTSPYSRDKEFLSDYAMKIADNILAVGGSKLEAKPFYDVGMKYMEEAAIKSFVDPKNTNNVYHNCEEVFINRR